MRVYELAKQLNVSGRDILLLLEELGVGGRTASSRVPPEYLDVIRVRLGGGARALAQTVEDKPRPTAAPAAPPVAQAQPAVTPEPVVQAPAPTDVQVEEETYTITIRPPVTVAAFATGLDTDAEVIVNAAAGMGEEVKEDGILSSELAVLIGEQWGYTVKVEEPEVVEEAPVPEPEPIAEPEPEPVAEKARVLEPAAAPALPPKRVVPRRVAAADAPLRPPVVTVLGHVDHGKTSLLDAIRQTNVVAGEAGAITQHIGAYQVDVNGRRITFIDTPGHEAFTAMRARGAQVTDIAVLVVAADDGVMPQTLEAVDHAQAAGVPIIVAVNKMDRPSPGIDQIKQRLSEKNLVPEEWGGDTIYVPVSALQKTGIPDLLEMILLVADLREFRARSTGPAEGVVLEAEMDRRRGPVATLLVQEGTLKTGDSVVMGAIAGKARAMVDERGQRIAEAGPATPVQIIGLSDVPDASEVFRVVTSDREARGLAETQRMAKRESGLVAVGPRSMMDISQLFATGEAKVLNLILKGDTQGTIEAIGDALLQMQTDEVKISLLHIGVGDVTESDVSLAAATKPTVIVGFQIGADAPARRLAADERVEIRRYDVIYDLLDDVRLTMIGMLEATTEESVVGRAEVRALFKSSRIGTIAGCSVIEGRVFRGALARVRRQGKMVYEGRIDSLRHLKDDVTEMTQGFECGITIQGFGDLRVGDVIECVEQREVRRSVL
ncbi:MAG: translation initiation factor IF-2 [Armatimonadota bacterium]